MKIDPHNGLIANDFDVRAAHIKNFLRNLSPKTNKSHCYVFIKKILRAELITLRASPRAILPSSVHFTTVQ